MGRSEPKADAEQRRQDIRQAARLFPPATVARRQILVQLPVIHWLADQPGNVWDWLARHQEVQQEVDRELRHWHPLAEPYELRPPQHLQDRLDVLAAEGVAVRAAERERADRWEREDLQPCDHYEVRGACPTCQQERAASGVRWNRGIQWTRGGSVSGVRGTANGGTGVIGPRRR